MEWNETTIAIAAPIVTLVGTFLITRWQVRKGSNEVIRQMQAETQILISRRKYDKTLDALQQCWGLLMYTTDNENDKAIITFVQDRTTKERTYYFDKQNLEIFITALRETFYEHGWGLYLSKDIKDRLFNIRGILWGLKIRGEKHPENKQKIEKKEVAESLFEIHNALIAMLKSEMEKIYTTNNVLS